MDHSNPAYQLTDHLFRREAGKMVAVLTRIFGAHHIEMAEDVVQDTLLQAFATWSGKGIPPNPAAWLYHVAKNKAIDALRRKQISVDTSSLELPGIDPHGEPEAGEWNDELIADDMLRMMFACCQPGIPREASTALILKTLCGFSTQEIAHAFLCPEDTISKRLYRAKEIFRKQGLPLSIPSVAALKSRTDAVLEAVYLLFNEGYNATREEAVIRKELMSEAMRLGELIIGNPMSCSPESFALMALMCFQASRSNSRVSSEGHIIVLAGQDRSQWDRELIARGNELMDRAASGYHINAYHLQAAIAWEHSNASSFESTNWTAILRYYDWLMAMAPSPVTAMHRAVAVMQVAGGRRAADELLRMEGRQRLEKHYLYHAVLGTCLGAAGDLAGAESAFQRAASITTLTAERELLEKKIAKLRSSNE